MPGKFRNKAKKRVEKTWFKFLAMAMKAGA
jgi:hypothetical protein